ncbi:MAG: endonuclease/exonuclease/phosphatase family protein [Cyanobacteria bacterium J06621_11]
MVLSNAKNGFQRCSTLGWMVGLSLLGTVLTMQAVSAETLRIMAANTTSGNRQSYDPGEGTRIFQGLQPDVVLIQEFNFGDNSESAIAAWVESTFGPEFDHYREDDAQIPNGVISRYPIIAAGEWNDAQVSNRDFAWAQIDIPGDRDLWAVSVHFLTRSGSVRNSEAEAVRQLVADNIPEEDYLVVGGDFNTRNSGESALRTLDAVVETDEPYPTDQSGLIGTNSSRRRPYDWVFADVDLDPLEVPVVIGENSFPNGLVFDSRVYEPLADVSPVERGDSGAINMQHMAVIRDFELPDVAAVEETPVSEEPPASENPVVLLGPSADPLESCELVSGAANADEFQHYVIEVSEENSQLEITLEGLEEDSDLDLYVRQGELPTLTEYDVRPWLNSSDERVVVNRDSVPSLGVGLWYISVDGYIPGTYRLSAALDKCD